MLKHPKPIVKADEKAHMLDKSILDFYYSEADDIFGAVMRDCNLCFWEGADNYSYEKRIKSPLKNFQFRIWRVEKTKTWITSDKTNSLYSWDLLLGKPTQLKQAHEGKILQFLEVPSHNMILISSLDKRLVIWDIDTLEPKCQMPVKNSIHSICYSAQLDVTFFYFRTCSVPATLRT